MVNKYDCDDEKYDHDNESMIAIVKSMIMMVKSMNPYDDSHSGRLGGSELKCKSISWQRT